MAPTSPALPEPRTEDLDGDGVPEVLAVVALESTRESEAESEGLYCWSADGKLLWTYRPADTLTFEGGMSFGPPWVVADYTVSGERARAIWVSVTDGFWWGSFIARIDPSGAVRRVFVHGGIPYRLAVSEQGGRPVVLAATISNEHASSGFFAFDGDGPGGRWPQEPSQFRCTTCETGAPLRYVLLPPSDMVRADGSPYNRPRHLAHRGNLVVLQVQEQLSKEPNFPTRHFRFDLSGRPLGFAASDGYAADHDAFHTAGRLDHSFEQCPDVMRPLATRMWTPTEQWQDITIPLDSVAMTQKP